MNYRIKVALCIALSAAMLSGCTESNPPSKVNQNTRVLGELEKFTSDFDKPSELVYEMPPTVLNGSDGAMKTTLDKYEKPLEPSTEYILNFSCVGESGIDVAWTLDSMTGPLKSNIESCLPTGNASGGRVMMSLEAPIDNQGFTFQITTHDSHPMAVTYWVAKSEDMPETSQR